MSTYDEQMKEVGVAPSATPKVHPDRGMRTILIRALKTFLQAFLAVVTAAGANVIPNVSTLKTAAVGGLAALLSFVQNLLAEAEK